MTTELTAVEVKEMAEQARVFTATDDRQLLMALQDFAKLVIAKHEVNLFNSINAQCNQQSTNSLVNNSDLLLERATRE